MIVLKPFNSTVRRFKKGDEVERPKTPEAAAELLPHTFDERVERKFIGEASETAPALPSPATVGRAAEGAARGSGADQPSARRK